MSSEPPNSPKKVADLTGESGEFILPKAPPNILPNKSRHSPAARPENQSLPSDEKEAPHDVQAPPIAAVTQILQPKSPPRQEHEHSVQGITVKEAPRAAGKRIFSR